MKVSRLLSVQDSEEVKGDEHKWAYAIKAAGGTDPFSVPPKIDAEIREVGMFLLFEAMLWTHTVFLFEGMPRMCGSTISPPCKAV